MTERVNEGLEKAQQITKDLLWDPAVEAALNALFVAVPVLNVWPLRQIISGLARYLLNKFYTFLRLVMDVTTIKFLNSLHQAAYVDASLKLKIIAYDKGTDSDEYKKAREEAKARMSAFTRVNQ